MPNPDAANRSGCQPSNPAVADQGGANTYRSPSGWEVTTDDGHFAAVWLVKMENAGRWRVPADWGDSD